ncbi:MAG: hypothetical protein ACREQ9_05065 [Candidatus Binatia bacterium]
MRRLAFALIVGAAISSGGASFAQGLPSCGNRICNPPLENSTTCPRDCTGCGDGFCAEVFLETAVTCPRDCRCGNGQCELSERATGLCKKDCFCGDGFCIEADLENLVTCPADCGCGNGNCEEIEYDAGTCPEDCDFYCGDGLCDVTEVACPEDCFPCGDGVCEIVFLETPVTCPQDCR